MILDSLRASTRLLPPFCWLGCFSANSGLCIIAMSSSPVAKRAKTTDENAVKVGDSKEAVNSKAADQAPFDYMKWFKNASEMEIFDRWFATDGNMSGGRFNSSGDWTGEFDCRTDWEDFEACLEQVPELAKLEERGVPIIRHCIHANNPPVPPSAMQKLIEFNPTILQERQSGICDPEALDNDDEPYRHNVSALVLYIIAPGLIIDGWDVSFDVCELLVKTEPRLLFYKDSEGKNGKSMLLWKFPEQGKKLLKEVGKTVDLKALEKEVQEDEEKLKEEEGDY